METLETNDDEARRAELGAFLKAMRARMPPEDAGMASGARRRVKGLRREEVAALAAMSTTWYVWLEQGRDVIPSARALESLARALQLNPVERAHLFRLARPARQSEQGQTADKAPSATLCSFVNGLTPHPAYVLDPLWDVVASNETARRLLGDFEGPCRSSRNVLMRMFLDEGWRDLFEGWEALACSVVAQFRASTAAIRHYPEFKEIVAVLQAQSPEFAELWARIELSGAQSWQKTLRHRTAGRITCNYSTLSCEGEDRGFWISIYVPAGRDDREKLERLTTD